MKTLHTAFFFCFMIHIAFGQKNETFDIAGKYFSIESILEYPSKTIRKDTNIVTVKIVNDSTIYMELSISNQDCSMPTFYGNLHKKSDIKFSGNLKAFENEEYYVTVFFSKNSLELKVKDITEWYLGASCWVEESYKKETASNTQ